MYINFVNPSFEILNPINENSEIEMAKRIEIAGRTCYKSEDKITEDSSKKFIEMIKKKGHYSVLEHENISVKIITNRGVTHELVRHRLCSFSQESTRYVNYNNRNFTFIIPCWCDNIKEGVFEIDNWITLNIPEIIFVRNCFNCVKDYKRLLEENWSPQQAREVLPNSLKTEIVVTCNIRQWNHIFNLRTNPSAHLEMVNIMSQIQEEFKKRFSIFFN